MLKFLGSYRLTAETIGIIVALMAARAALWLAGVHGMDSSPLASSIIGGGTFVMGLVVSGTLSDYRDAQRAPSDIAGSLYVLMREAESMEKVWGKPRMDTLRERLIGVVTAVRADISNGDTREGQAAVEAISESLLEIEESDVPANYVVRLRAEQSTLRKSVLKIYNLQREEFLPSAKAMITSIVGVITVMLLFTDMGGLVESVVTVGFLSFFFVYLLRLLNVIDKPFKVGEQRTDDDVSLFLLTEFMVQAQIGDRDDVDHQQIAELAEKVEEQLTEVEMNEEGADLSEALDDAVQDVVEDEVGPER